MGVAGDGDTVSVAVLMRCGELANPVHPVCECARNDHQNAIPHAVAPGSTAVGGTEQVIRHVGSVPTQHSRSRAVTRELRPDFAPCRIILLNNAGTNQAREKQRDLYLIDYKYFMVRRGWDSRRIAMRNAHPRDA